MDDTTRSALLKLVADQLEHGMPELCGVIMPDGDFVEVPNIHAEPALGFHMEPRTFLGLLGLGAVATWHTHPGKDPNLSDEDLVGFQQWPNLEHHIVGIRDGVPTVHSFKVDDGIVVTA